MPRVGSRRFEGFRNLQKQIEKGKEPNASQMAERVAKLQAPNPADEVETKIKTGIETSVGITTNEINVPVASSISLSIPVQESAPVFDDVVETLARKFHQIVCEKLKTVMHTMAPPVQAQLRRLTCNFESLYPNEREEYCRLALEYLVNHAARFAEIAQQEIAQGMQNAK